MGDGRIETARRLLAPPAQRENPWAMVGAAALAATGAVLMAGVMVLGPGVRFEDVSQVQRLPNG